MSKFTVKKKESEVVDTAKFDSKEDFKLVKLSSGKESLIHRIQADKLVKEGKAVPVKGAEIESDEESAAIRTKVKVTKK